MPLNEVRRVLFTNEPGDPPTTGQLVPLASDELRQFAAQTLAQEKLGQTG